MLKYGLQIVWVELLAVVWATADYVIVGRLLGSADLGLYQQAFRVTDLLIINVCFVAGRVLFPSYVKMNHSAEAIQTWVPHDNALCRTYNIAAERWGVCSCSVVCWCHFWLQNGWQ